MIYFDLDGVIRDLCQYAFGKYPNTWEYQINGKGIIEIFNDDKPGLFLSPVTEYYSFIKTLDHITIITFQLESWIPFTKVFLSTRFKPDQYNVIWVNSFQEKLDIVKEGDYIVEDYPFYTKEFSSKRCIMVDMPYNREVSAFQRVYNTNDLKNVFHSLTGTYNE